MIRTLITPQQQTISILVPQDYIGKQIEILLYAVDELTEEKKDEPKKRRLGLLEGKAKLPDDFNEPLDELKDYM